MTKKIHLSSCKYGMFMLVMLPFVSQCEKKLEGDVTGYHVPSCEAGEYYDGISKACVANLTAIPVAGFESFRNEDFNNRNAKIAAYISAYFATGYTFSVAPTCTEEVEYNSSMNGGFYASSRSIAYNCGFTLLNPAAEEVLAFATEDTNLATPIAKDEDGADAEGTERPEYDVPFLKVVVSKDDDFAKLMVCEYTSERKTTYLDADGKYDTSVESDDVFATNTSCKPYGASATVPASLRTETDATVKAFPFSLTTYLRGKRTENTVGGAPSYQLANEAVATTVIDTLNVNCGADGDFNFTVAFKSDANSPVTGTVTISSDPTTFFNSSEVTGVDDFTYIKARSILGCSTSECLIGEAGAPADEIPTGTYAFVGPYVYISYAGGTDVWKYTSGNKILAFSSYAGGKAAICDYAYTLKPKG